MQNFKIQLKSLDEEIKFIQLKEDIISYIKGDIDSHKDYFSDDLLDNYLLNDFTLLDKNDIMTQMLFNLNELETLLNLDKQTTIEKIKQEIIYYYLAYDIPEYKIKDEDLYKFFDITYELFQKKKIERSYYEQMARVVRFALATSLLKNASSFKMWHVIASISYLDKKYSLFLKHNMLTKKDITYLQNILYKQLKIRKITNMSEYKEYKKRKETL